MSNYLNRRRVHIRWRGAALTVVLAAILALPVSGLVALLLGIAHGIDPVVPPLGWQATYTLIAAAWLVHWVVNTEVNLDE